MYSIKFVCLFLLAGFPAVVALRCYQCVNLESSSRLFSGKSNPDCGEHGFDGDSVDKVSCGSGMQCAYYTATVKETAPVIGTVKVKVDGRGCVPDTGSYGCTSDNKDFRNIMKATNLLTSLTYRYTIEDIDICSCSEDLCNGGCSGTKVLIGHTCVSIFVFIGVAAAAVIILLGICCCCCCACCAGCCCRSKPQTTTVILTNPASPMAGTEGNPLSNLSTNDPGYGYDQYPQNFA